ncbi:calcium-activated potassium channel subunit alpha-1-like [Paramacrobiotus metropolitanus]|uniref:calcium-activated potassium channel subunit alpha-1-like n=1 Tax=Paramacrobiotus metropolitanus TaxID=2943436 RepID=UPI002445CD2B|nr:calcium-activated potassium channel subunit alpha-1-like [Paramacrobiotus metropolitanus]
MDNGTFKSASGVILDWTNTCGQRMWPLFLASCFTFAGAMWIGLAVGRGLLAVWEYRHRRLYRPASGVADKMRIREQPSWMSTVKFVVGEFLSLSTATGRALAFLEFCLGMTVLIIYFSRVSGKITAVESCIKWTQRPDLQLECICNTVLFLFFAFQFTGAMDKVEFLLSIKAMVTYFTIPPSFLSMIFNHDWIGLRCLRACHLLFISDYFRYTQLIKKATVRRLIHICTVIVTVTLVAAGIFHLLELTGDDWLQVDSDATRQDKSYWEWVYMSVVTLSTVGFGDISPKSTLGQIFCIMLIVGVLALFASAVPEIYEIISNWHKFAAPYQPERGVHHIVVSGHITIGTMQSLVKDLSRPDRRQYCLDIVFISPSEPSMEVKSFLKEVQTYVHYVQGSLLYAACLQNVKINDAEAYPHKEKRLSGLQFESFSVASKKASAQIQVIQR